MSTPDLQTYVTGLTTKQRDTAEKLTPREQALLQQGKAELDRREAAEAAPPNVTPVQQEPPTPTAITEKGGKVEQATPAAQPTYTAEDLKPGTAVLYSTPAGPMSGVVRNSIGGMSASG